MHGHRGLNRAQREIIEARKWIKSELNLRGLGLGVIPASVFTSPPLSSNITKLDLSHNSLTTLPACIQQLDKLHVLLLGHNKLIELPEEICGLKQLITLDASHNHFREVPASLCLLSKLENVNFSGNNICILRSQILKLSRLKKLFVTKNPIKNVPKHVYLSGVTALRGFFQITVVQQDDDYLSSKLSDMIITNGAKLQRILSEDAFSSKDGVFTSDYGSCSHDEKGSLDMDGEWYDDETCSCYGDHGSDSDADFDSDIDLSPRSDDDSDLENDNEAYSQRILKDRTMLIKYRSIWVQIPEHNKSNYRRDEFKLGIQEDWFYTPELSERTVHAGVVISLTPDGAQFYNNEPALIHLPVGVSVSSPAEVVCLHSTTTVGEIPDWKPLPRSDYYLNASRDTVTIKAYHFSLYTVVATRSYPEVSQPISASEGGCVEVNEVPGVTVTFPKGSLEQDIDAKIRVFYGDEPYGIDTNHDEPRALATPVVMLGPHGCQFRSEDPVTVRLPLPDCQQIIDRFRFDPEAKLSVWHSQCEDENELVWERYDGKFTVEKCENNTYCIVFKVTHFSWYKALWDILAHTLHGAKVGVSYFYPYIRFSMMCQAMMEENPDTKSFGLEVICYRSDKKLPEMGNYKHRVGGSTKPKMVRPGTISVRLASKDFEADTLHGEDESLTKVEHDFRGMEFDKQFACVFKDSPVDKGVFGKVFVDRIVTSDFKQSIFEYNLTKHGGEAEMNLDVTDRWSLLAVRELASMLNITSDNNWKTFAKHLGFTNHEIKNQLCSTNDPFAFMLSKYQSRGGTPDEFVQSLYEVGRQLRIDTGGGKLDQIGFAQKFSQLGFRCTDDEDSVSESSALAGPSGSGGRTPPRKRSSKTSEGTSSSKRRRRNSDPDQSDMSSGEFSPVKRKKPATITSDSAHRENREQVTDQLLWTIAPQINQKWKAVGRTLGVPETDLVCIQHDHQDVVECTFQMLFKWKTMNPKDSNYGALYTALCSNGLNSIATQHCSGPGTSS